MLDLNYIRQEFAEFLAKDPTRWRMDAALAHVVQLAYQRGLEDGKDRAAPASFPAFDDGLPPVPPAACPRCGGRLRPGKAFLQTYVGPLSTAGKLAGSGRMVDCLKCEGCGWSMT